jgi:hypothetical protein
MRANATAWLELFVSTEIATPMMAVRAVTGRNGDRPRKPRRQAGQITFGMVLAQLRGCVGQTAVRRDILSRQ